MPTILTAFRPIFAFLAAAYIVILQAPHAQAQVPPTESNTRDIGLIADPGDPIVASATTPQTAAPVYLYVFDNDGRPLIGNSGVGFTNIVAQLAQGTYYLAIWNGFTAPVQNPGFLINNFIEDQEFELDIDSSLSSRFITCPDFVTLPSGTQVLVDNECLRDVTYYRFYVGEPMNQPLGRVLTTKARYDFSFTNVVGNPRRVIFNESGDRVVSSRFDPGRYLLAIGNDLQASGDRFRVDLGESGPVSFNLTIRGADLGFFDLSADEIVWFDYEVRDEGPDTVANGDFTDLEPISITMTESTGSLVPNLALFRTSDRALVDSAATGGVSELELMLAPGDYIVAANGAGTLYGDELVTLARTSGMGTALGYDLTIGHELFANQTIEPGGDTDFYRFTVEPTPDLGEIAEGPQTLTFETSSADPTRDTELALYTGDGMLLVEDDNGGVGDLSSLEVAGGLPAGSYVVAVAGADTVFADDFVTHVEGDEDTGDYALEYTGGSEQSDLGFGGDVDMYHFDVGAPTDLGELGGPGDMIAFNTIGSQFDTAIAVWDGNGMLLESSDVPINGQDSIERSYASGVYHFGIAGGGATFADGFRINVDPAGPLGGYSGVAGVLLYDGTTSELDRFDLFRFEIAETCNAADLAAPFDVLDEQDILLYLTQFQNGTAPDFDGEAGQTFFDTLSFLALVDEGCP